MSTDLVSHRSGKSVTFAPFAPVQAATKDTVPMPSDDPFWIEQIRRNASSRERWVEFAAHREQVTGLLSGFAGPSARLCIVGAGNCNDVALPLLCDLFAEVHLVDLDSESIEVGVGRQLSQERPKLVRHGGIDVSGVSSTLTEWRTRGCVSDAELDQCLTQLARANLPVSATPFDVLASVCLLSQLLEHAAMAVGAEHERFVEFLQASRRQHLQWMVDHIVPGGAGLLITDIVSTQSAPEIATAREEDLGRLTAELLAAQNFFHGCNPFVIAAQLQRDTGLAGQVEQVRITNPWRWNLGPRIYVVAAILFRRRIRAITNPATDAAAPEA